MHPAISIAAVPPELWYHVIDLGDGLVTPGVFDIRPLLQHYGFPDDLTGKTVLDLGRSSGFFSFEFERRGADVTATDLPSALDKDFVGGEIARAVFAERWHDLIFEVDPVFGDRPDFAAAHKALGSRVRPLSLRLDDLTLDAVGGKPFDLVFAGSILNHVMDPVASLRRIMAVTGGRFILVNPFDPDDRSPTPRAELKGRRVPRLTTWWVPNLACLEEMLWSVGFEDVEVVSTDLVLTPRGATGGIPHAVLHASPQRDTPETRERWREIERQGIPRQADTRQTDRERQLAERVALLEAESAGRLDLIHRMEAQLAEREQVLAEQIAFMERDGAERLALIRHLEAQLAERSRSTSA